MAHSLSIYFAKHHALCFTYVYMLLNSHNGMGPVTSTIQHMSPKLGSIK